jgi:hypothetical protein
LQGAAEAFEIWSWRARNPPLGIDKFRIGRPNRESESQAGKHLVSGFIQALCRWDIPQRQRLQEGEFVKRERGVRQAVGDGDVGRLAQTDEGFRAPGSRRRQRISGRHLSCGPSATNKHHQKKKHER